jgi:hypothetical protein
MKFDKLVNVILEGKSYIGEIYSFKQLPDSEDYGYAIYPDGSFDIVGDVYEHEVMLKKRGFKSYKSFFSKGGVRMSYDYFDSMYYIDAWTKQSNSRRALNTAKDIAKFYNIDYKIEPLEEEN